MDILAGDLGATARWAAASELRVDDEPLLITEYGHLTLVRLLLAQCHLDADSSQARQALELVSHLAYAAESRQRTGSLMEIRLVQGLCHQSLGDDTAAVLALQAAFRVPEVRSQASKLVEDGPDASKRLMMLMPSVDAPQWVVDVFQRADKEPSQKQVSQSPPKKGQTDVARATERS